jgi:hypothetical protein
MCIFAGLAYWANKDKKPTSFGVNWHLGVLDPQSRFIYFPVIFWIENVIIKFNNYFLTSPPLLPSNLKLRTNNIIILINIITMCGKQQQKIIKILFNSKYFIFRFNGV